ncbi:dTMP kinase [Buchnera aphidicola]|uniref:dTMP kinase n=1 Tax=Buchnera aphidicola TaxID=9 RepID=UPI0031B87D64
MKNSQFIVVEGIEGSGKTSICLIILELLKQYNIKKIINVRQPGSTPIAEMIRNIIKNNNEEKLIKESELLLICAARLQLIENIIKPALQKGIWVISDRHILSSFAYQGGGSHINTKLITTLNKILFSKLNPNLTIYVDIDPKIGLKRVYARGLPDRIEKNSLEFFKRTRKIYLKMIKNNINTIYINGNQDINLIKKILQKKIKHWLKNDYYPTPLAYSTL